ncbi:hypothetical protein GCU56_17075 [Geodermatophilus sabuli]|uniref:Uncharacterized protein n=1 Tax=Geodermatophilus sabuli TaxID=1564158 RepID=A0A7K3W448_9ACTN|nr:hypothetical protein [Geodermatophilus sabuli]NEK59572.1 hypothetical protein [Geodermatophilus sabuli]
MSVPDDDVPAVQVLVAGLEVRPGGRLVRGARLLGAFVAELVLGLLPAPSLFDVVVTRRDDGTEVVRVPAGDTTTPGEMLRFVQEQLETRDVGTFLREWGD